MGNTLDTVIAVTGLSIVLCLSGIKCEASRIADNIEKRNPQIQTKNLIGTDKPEKFYDSPEGRAYIEIDGMPVDEYLSQKR
jgi:hypothetical protein